MSLLIQAGGSITALFEGTAVKAGAADANSAIGSQPIDNEEEGSPFSFHLTAMQGHSSSSSPEAEKTLQSGAEQMEGVPEAGQALPLGGSSLPPAVGGASAEQQFMPGENNGSPQGHGSARSAGLVASSGWSPADSGLGEAGRFLFATEPAGIPASDRVATSPSDGLLPEAFFQLPAGGRYPAGQGVMTHSMAWISREVEPAMVKLSEALPGTTMSTEAAVLMQGAPMAGTPVAATGAVIASQALQTAGALVPGEPGWQDALAQRLGWMLEGRLGQVEIALDPPELGPLQVRISTQNDQAQVHFISAQGSVRDALEQALPRLREMLEAQGLQLAQANVSDHGQRHPSSSGSAVPYHTARQNTEGAEGEQSEPAPLARRHNGLVDAYV